MKPINEHENLPFFEKWFFTDPYNERACKWAVCIILTGFILVFIKGLIIN